MTETVISPIHSSERLREESGDPDKGNPPFTNPDLDPGCNESECSNNTQEQSTY